LTTKSQPFSYFSQISYRLPESDHGVRFIVDMEILGRERMLFA